MVEPHREIVRQQGENVLRKEILETCNAMFPNYKIERVFFEKQIPVDARHNAKIHRLALSRKWTNMVSRKPSLGKLI